MINYMVRDQRVIKDYLRGMTWRAIQAKHGFGPTNLSRILRKHNIEFRCPVVRAAAVARCAKKGD